MQRQAGGAAFADVTHARSTADTIVSLAEATNLRLHTVENQEAAVAELARALSFVVVDNFESVVAAATGLIGQLLDASRRIQVLVTSREALDIEGEIRHLVAPLDDAAARALFERHALAMRNDFRISADDEQRGLALACRLVPTSALSLRVLGPVHRNILRSKNRAVTDYWQSVSGATTPAKQTS